MNIEGAERWAVHGMSKTLKNTRVLCISCHDFLADSRGEDDLRTKEPIQDFLRQAGFKVAMRTGTNLPPYLRDQVWAFNQHTLSHQQLGTAA